MSAARVLELLGCDVRGTAEVDRYFVLDGALLRVVLSALARIAERQPGEATKCRRSPRTGLF